MIQITRLLAKQVRTVFKKALGVGSRLAPDLRLTTGPDGLRIRAQSFEHAAEFHEPGELAPAELSVPFHVLDDVQGPRTEPVVFSLPKKNVLAATWEDRGTSRSMQYELLKENRNPLDFPPSPTAWTENPPALLAALRDAFATTDVESSRYALGCIQLQGKLGQLAATDGHQAFLAGGYLFGFEDDLLVRTTSVFSCKDVPHDQPVRVGRTETHLAIRVGPWTFWLAIETQGRFPHVEHIIPAASSAQTVLELAAEDAQFLVANVQRLHSEPESRAVTLDLGGCVALRAKDVEATRPVEMILSNSTRSGEDLRVNTDQRFLVRAAEMGFGRLQLYGPNGAVVARDDQRTYLWMSLTPDNMVLPSEDCLRIESPRARSSHATPVSPTTIPMNRQPAPVASPPPPVTQPVSAAAPTRRRRNSASATSSLDQAVALRNALRETVHHTNDLIRAMKKERQHQRLLKNTLKSLKDLQAAAA